MTMFLWGMAWARIVAGFITPVLTAWLAARGVREYNGGNVAGSVIGSAIWIVWIINVMPYLPT